MGVQGRSSQPEVVAVSDDLSDEQLLTVWLDDDEPGYPPVTDEELSRLLHLTTKSLGGAVGMSHDEAHMAMLRLIREVKRLRAEHERDAAELRAYRSASAEAAADRRIHALLAELRWLRDVNDELRGAYASAVAKLGSLPTGWQDDIDYRPELLDDSRGTVDDLRRRVDADPTVRAHVDALKVLGRIAVYAQRQAEHHEGDGMAGLARPWWHVVALATGEDGDVVEGRPDGAATGDDDE